MIPEGSRNLQAKVLGCKFILCQVKEPCDAMHGTRVVELILDRDNQVPLEYAEPVEELISGVTFAMLLQKPGEGKLRVGYGAEQIVIIEILQRGRELDAELSFRGAGERRKEAQRKRVPIGHCEQSTACDEHGKDRN